MIDLPWTPFQHKRPSRDYVQKWFDNDRPHGIGIIGGSVSGVWRSLILGLEFLDIDDPETVPLFLEHANYHGLSELLKQLPFERTPKGGAHIGYLCPNWAGNQVLAQKIINGQLETIIETRGSGGLCVVAPTPPGIHPKFPERGYELIQGNWTNIPAITKDERDVLLEVARGLTESVTIHYQPKPVCQDNRPGDVLNATADSLWWSDLLTKHGWKLILTKGGVEYWQRPGKDDKEWSATLGKCGQYFFVFSSNAAPFEPNRAYTPFAALTLLEHNGDYSEVTHTLKGEQMPFDEKARLILDKVFMAFGSQMHALERNVGDHAWKEYRADAWDWSIAKVSALVESLWTGEKLLEKADPPKPGEERTTITVKGVSLQSSGTAKNGRPWKRYKITDSQNVDYFTFHTSFQTGETYEIDWKWEEKGEKKWRTIPNTPVQLRQPGDE